MRRSTRRDVTRRSLLAGLGATAVGAGSVRAHPTPDGTDGGTTTDGGQATAVPDSYAPLGTATVEGAKEAVVDDAGETVYVAATDGFATVDVRDPRNPQVLAERRGLLADHRRGPMAQVFDAKVDGDRLLVVGPANPADAVHAALLYDVSDPAAPERLAVHETDYPIHNCFLRDGVAYLTANDGETNGLALLDAESGAVLGRWSVLDADESWRDVPPILRTCHDVWVQDGRAYLAYWDAGTWIVDVSDPAAPSLVAEVRGRDPGELADLGEDAVRAEQLELPGNDHYVTVNDDATLLGLGMEAWDQPSTDVDGGPGGVELWDVSTPTEPVRRSTIDAPPTPDASFDGVWTTSHNFELRGDRLYTSWYRGGVRVHDVSDPSNPVELRAWRDAHRASFWTARTAAPGEFFVASSVGKSGPLPSVSSDVVEPAGVYTFPDPPLETPTGSASDASSLTGPGFGALAGVAGVGLGAWRALRRRRRD